MLVIRKIASPQSNLCTTIANAVPAAGGCSLLVPAITKIVSPTAAEDLKANSHSIPVVKLTIGSNEEPIVRMAPMAMAKKCPPNVFLALAGLLDGRINKTNAVEPIAAITTG